MTLDLEAGALLEPAQAALPLLAGAVGQPGEVAIEVVVERDVRALVAQLDVGARRGQDAFERRQERIAAQDAVEAELVVRLVREMGGERVGEALFVTGAADDAEVVGADDAFAHEDEAAAAERRALRAQWKQTDLSSASRATRTNGSLPAENDFHHAEVHAHDLNAAPG